MLRIRFRPIVLCGDLKKAFLQVIIRESDRDVLRFHWIKSLQEPDVIEILRFTRALFGLNQSPFILAAVLLIHLERCKQRYPEEIILEIIRSLYVDDLIKGLITKEDGEQFKETAKEIFKEAGFTLHKWHSNEPSLEERQANDEEETTFVKQKFGNHRETKILGIAWDKMNDTLSVKIPEIEVAETKRGILRFLAAIYDPLGLICPVILSGKCIFRDVCEEKYGWDKALSGELLKRWNGFVKELPKIATVKRGLVEHREGIKYVDLHAFGDASKLGTGVAIYAVVHQQSGVSQGLVTAKARISKKTTIPRLELIAAVMVSNMMKNVRDVLKSIDRGVEIRKEVCWTDSSTVLHWIRGDKTLYKQFVRNQVEKITEKKSLITEWRHVPGTENPADIASRGAKFHQLQTNWWNGPTWLEDDNLWPKDINTVATSDTQAEVKLIKEVLKVAVENVKEKDTYEKLIEKFEFKKAIRIMSWVRRFIDNYMKKVRRKGPLSTDEINDATLNWVKKVQSGVEGSSQFVSHVKQLNLQKDDRGIYICMGRIQGMYPMYLPVNSQFTEQLVRNAHLLTLHGGVGLTMTKVRENYWVPQLRQLSKKIRNRCNGCKRMHATPLNKPPPGMLPVERTSGDRPFQVLGLDYAGPLIYKKTAKTEGKAYIMLYTCSLTRAIWLDLLPNQSQISFITSLKTLIARRGNPEVIFSDNFSTFVSTAKWLKRAARCEVVHDCLSSKNIKWRFNLSRAPWWGGQFERMVSLVKQALHKVVGRAKLSWEEMKEVLLDVEVTLNNRPLSYVEDDVEMPILTPNIMMFGNNFHIPEVDADDLTDYDLRKRARFLRKCKNRLWARWENEYLRGLRERHNLKHSEKPNILSVGDVMLIKGDHKNRAKWNIGIVSELITGRDGVIRGAKLRAGNNYLERAVQHLYPMELQCDIEKKDKLDTRLTAHAQIFRPRRNAALVASARIEEQVELENSVPNIE